jgi:hypothetical protein
MSSIYVSNYSTMHTKFQSRDNYGEGCRRVIARASGPQIDTPDDTAWGEANEKYFDALLKTEHQLAQAKGNIKTYYKIVRNLDRATAREYKSSPRRKSSDAKRTSSGDSGDPDQPEPPRSTCLTIPQLQQNSYFLSWQSAPNGCLVFGGGQR